MDYQPQEHIKNAPYSWPLIHHPPRFLRMFWGITTIQGLCRKDGQTIQGSNLWRLQHNF